MSIAVSVAERNYAMVKLELLALQWAKAHLYLLRAPSCVITDLHANARIQYILTKLFGFDMTLYWTQGMNIVTDALSLAYARDKRYPSLCGQCGCSPRNQGG